MKKILEKVLNKHFLRLEKFTFEPSFKCSLYFEQSSTHLFELLE